MAAYSLWMLEALNISVSGGASLSGFTQGDASHLLGEFITLENNDWKEARVVDSGSDEFVDDNDGNQRLRGNHTINGVDYGPGTILEAEYQITLRDPNTGIEYLAVGINVRNSDPSYATVEGLAFVDVFPPLGVALEVVDTNEGPGDFGNPPIHVDEFAFPICFTPGTGIAVPGGTRPVETLAAGDLVRTRDHGAQPIRWIGRTEVGPEVTLATSTYDPVRIAKGALGDGLPLEDLVVSQQHRILISGWKAELLFGEPEVLAAARHLVGRPGISTEPVPGGVTYLHLLLDRHEIVMANGAPAETFLPGPTALAALSPDARADLMKHLKNRELQPAREYLRNWEVAALAG